MLETPLPAPPPPTGHVQLPDAQIGYWLEGKGPPVLFIQGVGVAGCGWSPQVEAARERHTCCTFDNRGVGQSTGTPQSIEQMALDALALLDHLGWDRAHIVGHSMGGVIAQALLLAAPARVHSLALLCTVERGLGALQLSPAGIWRALRCQVGSAAARRRAFFRLVSPRRLHAAKEADILELERVFGRRLHEAPGVVMKQVRALMRFKASGRREALADTPCLVLSADQDFVCPPAQGEALAKVLGTTCTLVEGGHAVVVERAGVVNEALLSLWASA